MICNAGFELANGEMVSPCHLPKDHAGDHIGKCLGSNCRWPQGYASEEEMAMKEPRPFGCPSFKDLVRYRKWYDLHAADIGVLWDAEPNCLHVVVGAPGGGVKCTKCSGWFCY